MNKKEMIDFFGFSSSTVDAWDKGKGSKKPENLKWVSREENIVKTDNVLPLTSDEDINNSINSMVAMIDNVEELLLWLHTQDKYRETIF